MVDIFAALEAYEVGDISNVGWIRSHQNVADVLTKFTKCTALCEYLDSGKLTTKVEQWVVRGHLERETYLNAESSKTENK